MLAYQLAQASCPRAELVNAVALALATSGGDDAWSWEPSTAYGERYLGAFGLPVSELVGQGAAVPFQLASAARLAVELYRRHGDWSWSPAWRSGAYRRCLADARAGAQAPAPGARPPVPFMAELANAYTADPASAVARARATMVELSTHISKQL